MVNYSVNLTNYQRFVVIFSTFFGMVSLGFPRVLSSKSGVPGVYLLLGMGFVTWMMMFFLCQLARRFPGQSIISYAPHILGSRRYPKLGTLLSVPVWLLISLCSLGALVVMSGILNQTITTILLPDVHRDLGLLLFLCCVALAASMAPQIMSRLAELFFPLLILFCVILLSGLILWGDLANVASIGSIQWEQFTHGIGDTSFIYAGGVLLFMLTGFHRAPGMKVYTLSIGLVTALNLFVFLSVLAVFGIDEIQHIIWPTLELAEMTAIPHFSMERLEYLVLLIWIVVVFLSMMNLWGMLVQMIKKAFRYENQARISWAMVPVVFMITRMIQSGSSIEEYMSPLGMVYLIGIPILPILLYIIAVIRRKGNTEDA